MYGDFDRIVIEIPKNHSTLLYNENSSSYLEYQY